MSDNSIQTHIRPAVPADTATILELIKALADFEQLPPPDPAAQQRLISHAFGERPRFEVFLGEVEGKVAGYIFIFETYSTFLARPSLYLEDLFVLPEYRGRKVGYDLFRFCVEEANKRECGRMDWAVLDWNTHAQNFYRRMGGRHLHDWQPYRLTRDQFGEILEQE